MPITGTSTDYSTRKKDIHILQGVDANKQATITPSFGRISNYCAGIQKLVQRYTICLMTEMGSQTNFPEFGTELLSTLLQSNRLNRADIYPIFNVANLNVIQTFRKYQQATSGLPNDEQLGTAQLVDINVSNGQVSMTIQLYPLTGEPVVLLVPIPSTN